MRWNIWVAAMFGLSGMARAAVGDTNPVYQDADAAKKTEVGGIIAPPTFPQAVAQFDPDYPLRWRPNQPWFGSGKTPSGVTERPSGGGVGSSLPRSE